MTNSTALGDANLLRKQLFFADLPEQDLAWLLERAESMQITQGEVLIEEGAPADSMYIILEGEFLVTKRYGNSEINIATRTQGEFFGEMALLEQVPRTASVKAVTNGRLYKISKDNFIELLVNRPAATLSILRTVVSRLRNSEAMLHQSSKMASLGTLAAGLAHELNNPASAARRSSSQLNDTLRDWPQLTLSLGALGLDAEQTALIGRLREEMAQRVHTPARLDPLARSDREIRLQDWLESRAIETAWEIAPVLTSFGWQVEDVAQFSAQFSPAQFAVVIRWLCVGTTIYALLDEVYKSAERISEIVKAVKSYSYLDQAPVQEIDIHEGLENTLVILRNKLNPGITIQRDYARDLPRIEAYASELNQVWTNILDNAIDAMQRKGEIRLKTYLHKDDVIVEITDNGPGIPIEVQERIFDPFFTTKPPGTGTGLGLNITYNIIQNHHGHIQVFSKPGETTFRISLPQRLEG